MNGLFFFHVLEQQNSMARPLPFKTIIFVSVFIYFDQKLNFDES